MKRQLLIFTDLDGTLLDYHTYSFRKALPALRYIQRRKIPLIICTSKTRGEIEVYQKKIKNSHPFIAENGGGIFIPWNYFKKIPSGLEKTDGYLIKEMGIPYTTLRRKLLEVANTYGQKIKGFGDMSAKEIRKRYGLNGKEARLAKQREYDEPFYFLSTPDEKLLKRIRKEFSANGLKIVMGGRLSHLTGDNDKGKAVRSLIKIYEKEWKKKIISIGIGDSANDLPLLLTVNYPVVVKLHTGGHEEGVVRQLKEPLLTKGIGPEGWNEAVLQLLEKLGER